MDDKKLGAVESRFADIIWTNEPLHSRELVKLCEAELSWKKPTTYTVLRRLCERGIFQNEGGPRDLRHQPGGILRHAVGAVRGGEFLRKSAVVPGGLHPSAVPVQSRNRRDPPDDRYL